MKNRPGKRVKICLRKRSSTHSFTAHIGSKLKQQRLIFDFLVRKKEVRDLLFDVSRPKVDKKVSLSLLLFSTLSVNVHPSLSE